jgi:hypothetical protein
LAKSLLEPGDGEDDELIGGEEVRGGAGDLDGLSDPGGECLPGYDLEGVRVAQVERVVVEGAARGVDGVDLDVGEAGGGPDAGGEPDAALLGEA